MTTVLPTIAPEALIRDFGGSAAVTQLGVRSLYLAIAASGVESSQRGLREWLGKFRAACGEAWPKPTARLDLLAAFYGLSADPRSEIGTEAVLFALHTWYVIITRLLAAHVVAGARGQPSSATEFAQASHVTHKMISRFASGDVFERLGVTDPCCGAPFDWYTAAPLKSLGNTLAAASQIIVAYDEPNTSNQEQRGQKPLGFRGDCFRALYESLFPRRVRHALGEYYTPHWLVEHVLEQVGFCGQAKHAEPPSLLDPTCGSGAFLVAALERLRTARGPDVKAHELLTGVVGIDLHPLAVASARANYLLAIADLIKSNDDIVLPVYCANALSHGAGSFDFIVGNPPWVAWDNLPQAVRNETRSLWQQYGLFSLSGRDARHGGAKKDLSMLVLYSSADRYLKAGGRLGMVITQTIFQSKGAGDGFRRFELGPGGESLCVERVDDMTQLRPFAGAANRTSTIVLKKGTPTTYPVKYVKWSADERRVGPASPRAPAHQEVEYNLTAMQARPINPLHSGSPWTIEVSGTSATQRDQATAAADYKAHLGANSGGANAVYWLELQGRRGPNMRIANWVGKAKMKVDRIEAEIEPDLIYPLLRWTDVRRWAARTSAFLLLAQDPETRAGIAQARLERDYPLTLAYLRRFEPLLTRRAAYRRYQASQPFYSMYNIGPYTVSPFKVVWRRMDKQIRAAVVEEIDIDGLGRRSVVPQETCVLVACESAAEAHYLCAMMNSDYVNRVVTAHSVVGGKGFGTPSVLDYLPLRKFSPSDECHAELSALSEAAHSATAAGTNVTAIAAKIDAITENLFQ